MCIASDITAIEFEIYPPNNSIRKKPNENITNFLSLAYVRALF